MANTVRAADAARATPPGYRPPSLIPSDYHPQSLLTLSPEQQLEVYKRIEAYYAGQPVKRGSAPSQLPVAAKSIAPVITWRGKTYDDITQFMEDARMSGVLVLKDGQVVLERYALGRTAQDRWTSFSVGKSITALLVGAALQDGAILSLDEPVTKYIPELHASAYEGVSIRQLLTMTSGVQWSEDYADPNSDVARVGTLPAEPGINTTVSYMRGLPRAALPGSVFKYKTGETDLAGVLVANATGRGLAQYLSEKIWAPFGMEQDAFWMVDRSSMERGGCCLSMSLRDYGRVGLFVLGGGVAGGKPVVPDWYLKEATSKQTDADHGGGYGYFWWIDGPHSFAARGIFGQTIQIVPSLKLVVVTNSAFPRAFGQESAMAVRALNQAAVEATQAL